MAVYKADILDVELNTGNIARSFLCHNIGKDDTKADRFGVRVYRDGEPESLSGCSIQGYMMRPNGTNLAITGSNTGVSGNEAWVDLPQAAYDYEGQFCLALKLIGGGVTGTIRIIDGMINNTFVDDALVPMQSVPTYQEILAVYDQMVAAKNGSVRFDQSQSLTETQKSVARMNIDAASDSDVADLKSALNVIPEVSSFNWELGLLTPGSGTETSSTTRIRSDFVPVSVGTKITLSGNENCLYVFLYKETQEYLGESTWCSSYVVSNDNARYARVIIRASTSNPTLYERDIPTQIARLKIIYELVDAYKFRREINALTDTTALLQNKFDQLVESAEIFSLANQTVTGTASYNAKTITLDFVPNLNDIIYLHIDSVSNCITDVCARIELRVGNTTYGYVNMTVDDVMNDVSISKKVDSATVDGIRIVLYRNASSSTSESGTTTFTGISVRRNYDGVGQAINKDIILTENNDFKALDERIKSSSAWVGKKIVWFGTSIPAGSYDGSADHKYPNIVGTLLGATVYNEAVGSSSISRTMPSAIDAQLNPYGYDTHDFEYAARGLTNTIAMEEWLIANYNNGFFTANVPSSMGTETQERLKGYSYENKVDRYLTSGAVGNVDLYVFDQGYNDYFHNRDVEALEAEYGIDTVYCYDGGMNFLIRRILKANPDAKIVIISHYTDNATDSIHSTTAFVERLRDAQKAVAARWGIKFINIYEKLGWSGQMITTNGYWDSNNRWVNSGGNEQSIQVKDIHVRDTIHPYTDASGKSNNRIAEVLAAEISSLIR